MFGKTVLFVIGIVAGHANGNFMDMENMFKWILPDVNVGAATSYGHYCGLGGNGSALDRFDKCCKIHDACYGDLQKFCGFLHGALVPYKWDKSDNGPECRMDQKDCRLETCRCDRDIIMCMFRNKNEFRKAHIRKGEADDMNELDAKLHATPATTHTRSSASHMTSSIIAVVYQIIAFSLLREMLYHRQL